MDQIIKTLDDEFDTYQAEKAQREAAEKVAKDAEMAKREDAYKQERAEAFRARVAARMPHLKAIVACIDRYETSIDETDGNLIVGDINVTFNLEFVDSRPHSRWQHAKSAVITVRPAHSSGGRPSRFPQLKTGAYSYSKIAAELVSVVASTLAQRQREAAAAANQIPVTAIREEFDLESYSYLVTPSADPDRPVMLNLARLYTTSYACTPEHAREILNGLKALGIQIGYEAA